MNRMRRCTTLVATLLLLTAVAGGAELPEREQKRKALNAEFDKLKLREMRTFVVDCSDEFLRAPTNKPVAGEFTIAKDAPTMKLQILPDQDPEYFTGGDQYMTCWANWAYVARSPDNRFYMAASDHLARGCQINVYEYRPRDDVVERVIDVSKLLGWSTNMYTDGKIHGHMGVMPDGTLWGATHHGVQPKDEWFEAGYRGSWLFSYDTHTGVATDWGVPLVGNSLPCFTVDTRRGRLVGTGYKFTMLTWDCIDKKVRFAGYPPNGWQWWRRAMLCDDATGFFWSMDDSEEPYRMMSFDPELNRFERYDLEVPKNPVTGKEGRLRGHTDRRDANGWYYWATQSGAFFRFRPDGEDGPAIEVIGANWDEGRDTLQMAIGPHGRYVYFQPKGYPSPLVQYDTKTGKKKALCFLQDYTFEKYGYWMGGHVYGMNISNDGSFVVIVMNGTFSGRNKYFGHPALVVVSIPEEERPVD